MAASLASGVVVSRDFDAELKSADVIMMLRVQKERLAGLDLNINDYIAQYQLTAERLQRGKRDAIVMHPGPMIRGMEITADAADGRQSVIVEQVRNGVFVRMAIMARAFAMTSRSAR
jgi:aspartate carbamoyltransferase catalytic subunit